MIVTACVVLPLLLPTDSIARTISIPSMTEPNTTCFPSNHGVSTVVMKNWLPFVEGPECNNILWFYLINVKYGNNDSTGY